MSETFAGKKVAVTGAASGIGRAVAESLNRRGASVLAADFDQVKLAELDVYGIKTCHVDLTDSIGRLEFAGRFSGFDALVNAAGVIRLVRPDEATEHDWDSIFAINAKALFFLCQAFAATVPDGGRIVNLSSVAARTQATLETCVYAASKATVVAITRSFAHLLGPRGVCVNAVLPGIVDTPMQDKVVSEIARQRGIGPEQVARDRLGAVPFARTATADECGDMIVALLGQAGRYVTGQAIAVDGGYTMV